MRAEQRYAKLNRDRQKLQRERWDRIWAIHREYDAKIAEVEAEFYANETKELADV